MRYFYASDFSQAESLHWICQRLGPKLPWRDKLWLVRWLAVWGLSPDRLSRKLKVCDFCQALRWSKRAWGSGVQAVVRLWIVNPGSCLTTAEKSRKNTIQCNERALRWSTSNAIGLVYLDIAGDSLDWPPGTFRPWMSRQATKSTLGQRICPVTEIGVPHISQDWVKTFGQGTNVVSKQRNTHFHVYLPVAYVLGVTSSEGRHV